MRRAPLLPVAQCERKTTAQRAVEGRHNMEQTKASPKIIVAAVCAAILIPLLLIGGCGAAKGLRSPGAGEVGVVRDGGPFDDRALRQVLPPGSGLHYTGVFSSVHYYPTTQRNYTIEPSGDAKTGQQFYAPSKDSYRMFVDAQVQFTLNTEQKTIETFDTKYGLRDPFPWKGSDEWLSWLNQWVRPPVWGAFREEIAQYDCSQLNSSCALAKGQGESRGGSVSFGPVEQAIKVKVQQDLDRSLRGHYIIVDGVKISNVVPSDAVEKAVDEASSAKAHVTTERYRARQAKYKAQATLAQARANRANPWAGLTEALKQCGQACVLNIGGADLNLGFNR